LLPSLSHSSATLGQCSSITCSWAGSELQTQLGNVGSRPHILPLASGCLGQYQIILLGDRGTAPLSYDLMALYKSIIIIINNWPRVVTGW